MARIDRERLWASIRSLERGTLLQLLQRALEHVPAIQLELALGDHFEAGEIGARAGEPRPSLRAEVDQFCGLAEAGVFYEVIQYRGREQSHGTQEFAARLNALLKRCVVEQGTVSASDLRYSLERLMGLLRAIDEFLRDIVYVTDEGRSWRLPALWARVLPAYFECLARTSSDDEYRAAADAALSDFAALAGEPAAELRRVAERLRRLHLEETPVAPQTAPVRDEDPASWFSSPLGARAGQQDPVGG